MPLSSMEEALEDLKAGKILIVVDDEKRENEGDLVVAAEKVTPGYRQLPGYPRSGSPVYAHEGRPAY